MHEAAGNCLSWIFKSYFLPDITLWDYGDDASAKYDWRDEYADGALRNRCSYAVFFYHRDGMEAGIKAL